MKNLLILVAVVLCLGGCATAERLNGNASKLSSEESEYSSIDLSSTKFLLSMNSEKQNSDNFAAQEAPKESASLAEGSPQQVSIFTWNTDDITPAN